MARPRGVVAWAVIRAILQAGQATHKRVHGLLSAGAERLANASRYPGGATLVQACRAATVAAVQRALRTLAHYGHLSPVGSERCPGARRPMRVYGLPVQKRAAADASPLAAIMSMWGAPARS